MDREIFNQRYRNEVVTRRERLLEKITEQEKIKIYRELSDSIGVYLKGDLKEFDGRARLMFAIERVMYLRCLKRLDKTLVSKVELRDAELYADDCEK